MPSLLNVMVLFNGQLDPEMMILGQCFFVGLYQFVSSCSLPQLAWD
jgi:hypothetical protein